MMMMMIWCEIDNNNRLIGAKKSKSKSINLKWNKYALTHTQWAFINDKIISSAAAMANNQKKIHSITVNGAKHAVHTHMLFTSTRNHFIHGLIDCFSLSAIFFILILIVVTIHEKITSTRTNIVFNDQIWPLLNLFERKRKLISFFF